MRYFDPDRLAPVMRAELLRRGAVPEGAGHVVASVIGTSLRGVDSHGIVLFPHYCRALEAGRINRSPSMVYERSAPGTGTLDADHGFGHHAGAVAMEKAVEMALEAGIGAVSVRNSTHFGAASYFALMAPPRDCLGFAFTNADALVKAYGAKDAFFGTNPICFTAPLRDEEPLCLDMATSLVSWNRIKNYRRENRRIPVGWAFDSEGMPVEDPSAACSLNPAGEYKGYGLGMMVDILCAFLAGGLISKDIPPMYAGPLDDSKRGISHFFMALQIRSFSDPETFRARLQETVNRIRALEPLVEGEPVMVPGDPEKKAFSRRIREGIPVDEATLEEFLSLNREFCGALRP